MGKGRQDIAHENEQPSGQSGDEHAVGDGQGVGVGGAAHVDVEG